MRNEIKLANKILASRFGIEVMPTAHGVMCIIPEEDKNLSCPRIFSRINCSTQAGASTILRLAIERLKQFR